MTRAAFAVASIAFFPAMVAIDAWFFRRRGMSYLDWYIANGAIISVTASLFTVVWKNLNDNPNLISADPRLFLSANLMLIAVQFQAIGRLLDEAGAGMRAGRAARWSDIWDGFGSLLASALMVVVMTIWFVAIVPLQYFIVLVAGAPARLALKLQARRTVEPASGAADAADWKSWEANFLAAPVSMTNAFAALLILAIRVASLLG